MNESDLPLDRKAAALRGHQSPHGREQFGFLRAIARGHLPLEALDPFPEPREERPEFAAFHDALQELLRQDTEGAEGVSPRLVDGLGKLGAFGMLVPGDCDGLGFGWQETAKLLELVSTRSADLALALLWHNSSLPAILVEHARGEMRSRYLRQCARGPVAAAASPAFSSGGQEAEVRCGRLPGTDRFVLDGIAAGWGATSSADLLLVLARDEESGRESAFVVETQWPGVTALRARARAAPTLLARIGWGLQRVEVPLSNLLGEEGDGPIVLRTLRESISRQWPAVAIATARHCLALVRHLGATASRSDAPATELGRADFALAEAAGSLFAMESASELVCAIADRHRGSGGPESAAVAAWCSRRVAEIFAKAFELHSLPPEALDQVSDLWREVSGMRPWNGVGHALTQVVACELLVGASGGGDGQEFSGGVSSILRVAGWSRYAPFGGLAPTLRAARRLSRRLNRALELAIRWKRSGWRESSAALVQCADAAGDLLAMSAALSRAHAMRRRGHPDASRALALAALHARAAGRAVGMALEGLRRRAEVRHRAMVATDVAAGRHLWLEHSVGLRSLALQAHSPTPAIAAVEEGTAR